MLHSAKKMKGFDIVASDGKVGSVEDLYFDDQGWAVRYMVADAGGWLTGRRVLITPISVERADWPGRALHLRLTQQQIKDSPGVDTHKPISRQHEADLYRHYGYPEYWGGPYLWGYAVLPNIFEPTSQADPQRRELREQLENEGNDSHLRSCAEVVGYHIRTTDDSIGHVEDFLFDDRDWAIRLMLVDTRNWWPGKHVLVSPQRIERVDWANRQVVVKVTRAELEGSPEYDAMHPPQTEPPGDLYRPVNRPPDWP